MPNNLQRRALDLVEKAGMPWREAEALALSEAGVTSAVLDELIGEHGPTGLDSVLVSPNELRAFARSLLVWSPLNCSDFNRQVMAQRDLLADALEGTKPMTHLRPGGFPDCRDPWDQPPEDDAEPTETELDAERYRFLCARPDWRFIELLCRQVPASSAAEFKVGMDRAIDAMKAEPAPAWPRRWCDFECLTHCQNGCPRR